MSCYPEMFQQKHFQSTAVYTKSSAATANAKLRYHAKVQCEIKRAALTFEPQGLDAQDSHVACDVT